MSSTSKAEQGQRTQKKEEARGLLAEPVALWRGQGSCMKWVGDAEFALCPGDGGGDPENQEVESISVGRLELIKGGLGNRREVPMPLCSE